MSMPVFPDKDKLPSLEQALRAVIMSIAMEETALSHVITAESKKIQYVIDCAKAKGCGCASIEDILAANKSVAHMLEIIAKLQEILKEKLAIALKHYPKPPPPPPPPDPSCKSVFKTEKTYTWYKDRSLFLLEHVKCNNGVRLLRKNCESLILLPHSREIEIKLGLDAKTMKACPAAIDIEFRHGNKIVRKENLLAKNIGNAINSSHTVNYKTLSGDMENSIIIRLMAPMSLSEVNATVSVKVIKGTK